MKKVSVIIQSIVSVLLVVLIAIMFFINVGRFVLIYNNSTNGIELSQYKQTLQQVEGEFQRDIKYKEKFIDLYGYYKRITGQNIVGNFEYIADDDGVLHMINDKTQENVELTIQQIMQLDSLAKQKEIPFVYIQGPNREIASKGKAWNYLNHDNAVMSQIVSCLVANDVDVIDLRELFENSKDATIDLEEIFFHTDLHMQTDAEIWASKQVANYLKNEKNLDLTDLEIIYDLNNYKKETYEFIGNYGRNNGALFVGTDKFDIYHPKFETDLSFYNNVSGEEKSGTFEDVLLNGQENCKYDLYTYWITNYLQFQQPSYTIKNNNCTDGVKILIVTDSIAYRSISHLALAAGETTIVDPRFFNGNNYLLDEINKEKYDLVLVWQATFLDGLQFFY